MSESSGALPPSAPSSSPTPAPAPSPATPVPALAVIIACRNGAATLGETLEGLAAQEWDRPWEVILADNGSSDGSVSLFQAFAAAHPRPETGKGPAWRVIDASAEAGKPYALNLAIAATAAPAVAFCDADDVVGAGWLAAMGTALQTHPIVASRIDFDRLNPGWIGRSRGALQQTGLEAIGFLPDRVHAGGGTLGLQTRVVDTVGGFDRAFAYLEDTEFTLRAQDAGFAITFVPEAVMHVRARDALQPIFRQSYNWGRSEMQLVARYRDRAPFEGGWGHYLGRWRQLLRHHLRQGLRPPADTGAPGFMSAVWLRSGAGRLSGQFVGMIRHGVPPYRPLGAPPPGAGLLRRRLDRLRAAAFPTVTGARTGAPVAAITFDDGPDPETTPAVLEVLARHGAKATFFLIGTRAAQHPELVARIVAEGHAIGNHSWDHPALPTLSAAGARDQLRRAQAAITAAAPGTAVTLMRPPYGDQSLASYRAARRQGLTPVIWSVVGADWADEDGATIAARILQGLHPGAIVLLHDSLGSFSDERHRDRGPMLAALDAVLAARPESGPGWRFVTVPALLAEGKPRRRWWVQRTDPAYLAALRFHPDLGRG